MESLKILTFLRYPPWDKRASGGQFSAWTTIRKIAERGHFIRVVIGETSEHLPNLDNLEFYKSRSYEINKSNFSWLRDSLKFEDVDLIYGFDPENFLTNMYWKKILGTPIIHEVKSPRVSPLPPVRYFYKISSMKSLRWHSYFSSDSYACKFSDVIFVPSKYSKKMITDSYNVNPLKITVIPNGIDRNALKKRRKTLDKDNVNLIFIGKLSYQKGLDVLIKSIREVKKSGHNVTLRIIGDGDFEKYKLLVSKLDLNSNIKFLGRITGEDKFSVLSASDIFVFPSNYESFGNVLVEAMARSLPIISTNTTAIPEVVGGDAGILISPNDPISLARAINCLIENPRETKRMGIAGYKRVEKYYTWDKIIDWKINIFKNLIDSRG